MTCHHLFMEGIIMAVDTFFFLEKIDPFRQMASKDDAASALGRLIASQIVIDCFHVSKKSLGTSKVAPWRA